MRWFQRTEKRETSYTDEIVASILSRAGNISSATPGATGAVESVSGLVARAFSAAEISGPDQYVKPLTPSLLSMLGRALIRKGEIVFVIDTDGESLSLYPASSWTISGGYDPRSWLYGLDIAGPSQTVTRKNVSGENLLHFRYSSEPDRPWRGVGPLGFATEAARLSGEISRALADESAGPRGHVLPVPKDGRSETLEELRGDLKKLSGDTALVESIGSMMGQDRPSASEWTPKRIGASPGRDLIELMRTASQEIQAATGISPALFSGGDGSASREANRQTLFMLLSPLGKIVEEELSSKFDLPISISWQEIRASDLAGRSRALQSMVGAGMDLQKAVALSGLLMPEDS